MQICRWSNTCILCMLSHERTQRLLLEEKKSYLIFGKFWGSIIIPFLIKWGQKLDGPYPPRLPNWSICSLIINCSYIFDWYHDQTWNWVRCDFTVYIFTGKVQRSDAHSDTLVYMYNMSWWNENIQFRFFVLFYAVRYPNSIYSMLSVTQMFLPGFPYIFHILIQKGT